MINIDKQGRSPVYEQIKNQILTLINLGVYPPHSKLPSIRAVSAETGVNINTVKRAFSELEISGVIYSVPGTGSFVSDDAAASRAVSAKAQSEIAESIRTAKSIGVTKEELMQIIEDIYREG